jgi:ubiquinol-cytochrome c reductase cytochrome b subunit
MFSALLIILSVIFLDVNKVRGFQFRPLSKLIYYMFGAIFVGLMILGAKHVESPFIEYGQFFTLVYFAFFLVILPILASRENYILTYLITDIKSYFNIKMFNVKKFFS